MFDILLSWFGKSRTNFTMDEFSQLIAQASEKEHYDIESFIKEFRMSSC
jgi:hypothetical protein